ncbi:MAG: HipA domain-containing protein [Duodenibacillus sp.]|nr:HipA domain-containing protein [Duodenibacillus sp.]
MIDFTNAPERGKCYGGADCRKLTVLFEGGLHMLKFPKAPPPGRKQRRAQASASEYLGCHVFEAAGIPVQATLLGVHGAGGERKLVAACRDFTGGRQLMDFVSLKNSVLACSPDGRGTELGDIMAAIAGQRIMDPRAMADRFWDMFVVDALIGNGDRDNGNWGFLYDAAGDKASLAPIYDCGACLFPEAGEADMERILGDPAELERHARDLPLSAIKAGGQRIRYFDFMASLENEDCNRALMRIHPRIDMGRIGALVDAAPLTAVQKRFYKTILRARKERILDAACARLCAQGR